MVLKRAAKVLDFRKNSKKHVKGKFSLGAMMQEYRYFLIDAYCPIVQQMGIKAVREYGAQFRSDVPAHEFEAWHGPGVHVYPRLDHLVSVVQVSWDNVPACPPPPR
jgi:hypothetical protein